MKILIERTHTEKATYGEASVINQNNLVVFKFKTLELPWNDNQRMVSCIPEGTYNVHKMEPNKKRAYFYFWVMNVPGRDAILFHPGNYTRQILGCILPGESFKDLDRDGIIDITDTTRTLKKLTDLMPDIFKLTIKKKE
jgi:hypothetical protein